jgi:hypothetical protein
VQDERSTVGLSLHRNPKAKRRYRVADAFLGMSVAFLVSTALAANRRDGWCAALAALTFLVYAFREMVERHQREADRYLNRPD